MRRKAIAIVVLMTACSQDSEPQIEGEGWIVGSEEDASPRIGPPDTDARDAGPPTPRDGGIRLDLATPSDTRPPPDPADSGAPIPGGRTTCTDPQPPPRCAQDPSMFSWSGASVIDVMRYEGTETRPVCCFDFTGDNLIDNALGVNLANFGLLQDVNSDLRDKIDNGTWAMAIEFDGLTDVANTSGFRLYWWRAQWTPETTSLNPIANSVSVSATSIDAGVHALTQFGVTTLAAGDLIASDGVLSVPMRLFDADLWVPLRHARIHATIDAGRTNLPSPGVALDGGKLGGVIAMTDFYTAINDTTGDCGCLGLGNTPLLDVRSGNCFAGGDAQACYDAGRDRCGAIAEACSLYSALSLFADVDLNNDGLNDAVSVGATFTASPATIVGVSP